MILPHLKPITLQGHARFGALGVPSPRECQTDLTPKHKETPLPPTPPMPPELVQQIFLAVAFVLITMLMRHLQSVLDWIQGRQLSPRTPPWPISLFVTPTMPEILEKANPAWAQQDRTFIPATIAPMELDEVWMRDRRDKTFDEWLAEPPRWSFIPSRSPRTAMPCVVIAAPEKAAEPTSVTEHPDGSVTRYYETAKPIPPPLLTIQEGEILSPPLRRNPHEGFERILKEALNDAHKLIAKQQAELDLLHRERDFWKHRTLKKRGKRA